MKVTDYNIGLVAKSSRKFDESFEYNKKQEIIDLSKKSQLELERVGDRYSYSKDEIEFEKKVIVKALEKLYSIKEKSKSQDEKVQSEQFYETTTLKWDKGALFDNENATLRKNEVHQIHKSAEVSKLNFETKGFIITADGKEINFDLNLNLSHEFIGRNFKKEEFIDPLIINFDSPSINLSSKKFEFDIDSDGFSEQISYLNEGSGFLALDKNGDGIINDGSELFGTNSSSSEFSKKLINKNGIFERINETPKKEAIGGFEELSLYDEDKNGFIDENDEIFDKLRIWRKSENESKLVALGEVGIGAIYLGNAKAEYALKDENNNALAKIEENGIAIKENGDIVTVQGVNFSVKRDFFNMKGDTNLEDIFEFNPSFIAGVGILLNNTRGDREIDITKRIANGSINEGIDERFNSLINNKKIKFSNFNSNSDNSSGKKEKDNIKLNLDTSSVDKAKEMALKNLPKVKELKAKIISLEKELVNFKFQLKSENNFSLQLGLKQNIAKVNSKINYNNATMQALKAEEFLASMKS